MNELEQQNEELLDAQASDKNALGAMDDRYSQAMAEIDALKAQAVSKGIKLATVLKMNIMIRVLFVNLRGRMINYSRINLKNYTLIVFILFLFNL